MIFGSPMCIWIFIRTREKNVVNFEIIASSMSRTSAVLRVFFALRRLAAIWRRISLMICSLDVVAVDIRCKMQINIVFKFQKLHVTIGKITIC